MIQAYIVDSISSCLDSLVGLSQRVHSLDSLSVLVNLKLLKRDVDTLLRLFHPLKIL